MKRILILGAGTGGTIMANRLAHRLADDWTITIVDRDDDHVYQPGLLLVPFGDYHPEDLVRPRSRQLSDRVELVLGEIDRIDPEAKKVALQGGTTLDFDLLVVATGCRITPEETEGLTGDGWGVSAHEFYTLAGATKLAPALEKFQGGTVAINAIDMPIKCPVAPLEFIFLADAFFRKKGIRNNVDLVYVTPLDAAFTKPVAAAALGSMMKDRNIRVVTDFGTDTVAGRPDGGQMNAYDGRQLDYNLLVSVPLHHGSESIERSGMGDPLGYLPTDKHTLQSKQWPFVFALGDGTDLPTSKAGSVAHFQAEVLIENIVRYIAGRDPLPDFDGHANCFIETGHDKAMLIDFNYETQPLPGRFPMPVLGPFSLLEETKTNHMGKLGFRWVYWNMLLPGKDLPIDHRMLMTGKRAA